MDPKLNQIITRLAQIFEEKKSGAILFPPNATLDTVAAATSLYLYLLKLGKEMILVSESKPDYPLTGVEKIQNQISAPGNNLVISFPYKEGAIDNIDYGIEGDYFSIIITPGPEGRKIDPSEVKYRYTGGKIDFFIIIDCPTFQSLGSIYTENQTKFSGVEIINIDRHLTNSNYGTVNLVVKSVASISELVFGIMEKLKGEIDKEMASNLYAGILSGTNNFTSYSVSANTLEAAARLLKLGAVKKLIKTQTPKPFSSTLTEESQNPNFTKPFLTKKIPLISEKTKPIEAVESVEDQAPETQAPQDWLKPKIFRGGGLI